MVTKVVSYTACDGTIFTTEQEALDYEKSREEEVYHDIGTSWGVVRSQVTVENLLTFVELNEHDIRDYLMYLKANKNSV